jgi:hypothetical protein
MREGGSWGGSLKCLRVGARRTSVLNIVLRNTETNRKENGRVPVHTSDSQPVRKTPFTPSRIRSKTKRLLLLLELYVTDEATIVTFSRGSSSVCTTTAPPSSLAQRSPCNAGGRRWHVPFGFRISGLGFRGYGLGLGLGLEVRGKA